MENQNENQTKNLEDIPADEAEKLGDLDAKNNNKDFPNFSNTLIHFRRCQFAIR